MDPLNTEQGFSNDHPYMPISELNDEINQLETMTYSLLTASGSSLKHIQFTPTAQSITETAKGLIKPNDYQ